MARKQKKTLKDIIKSRWGGFILIFLGFFSLLLINPEGNLFQWVAAKREISQQARQARKYQMEIIQMEEQIQALTNDKDTLEKFAREKFHFTAPGETVYLTDK